MRPRWMETWVVQGTDKTSFTTSIHGLSRFLLTFAIVAKAAILVIKNPGVNLQRLGDL